MPFALLTYVLLEQHRPLADSLFITAPEEGPNVPRVECARRGR